MNTYKTILFALFIIIGTNLKAQISFDLGLSETSSEHMLIPHNDSLNLPDSIAVKGFIAKQQKGICGEICAGGTIKFELSEKLEGYPHSYIYLVSSCVTGESTKEIISLNITKYTGNETQCFYKDVVDIIDSKGIPYYKLSPEETKKTTTKD